MRLKSLYVGTFSAMIGILVLSFLVFHAISDRMQSMTIDPTFDRMDELQLESARGVFENGGKKALKDYMSTLNRVFRGEHYLLDGHGIDMVSGDNRIEMLPPPPQTKSRIRAQGHWIISHRSQDGKYWFAAIGITDRPRLLSFLPYYFLVIGATGILCWLAAVGVIAPIHRIASTIAIFGQGDLSVRVATRREDEIGQLGRSFNQMAERLERLIVSERRLLGDISHELRSPLARLKFAVKLARTSPDPESALDRIERDINRISSLVADIVEITIVEGDPVLRGAEPVPLANIVDEVVHDCAVEAQIRGCSIEVSGRTGGTILGNHELLRRAVENVVRNAIRYSPEKSAIRISVTEQEPNAIIEVRDFGPGVPEDALARLFDPFFRVEEARNTNGGGSGLGLSIAKRAVQLHLGTIVAQNAAPGLRVEITIPLMMNRA
ncbi:MAG TPA: ATP-binding protein [Terracidiphilus sp.]